MRNFSKSFFGICLLGVIFIVLPAVSLEINSLQFNQEIVQDLELTQFNKTHPAFDITNVVQFKECFSIWDFNCDYSVNVVINF